MQTHRTQGTNDGSHPLRRSRPKGQKSHLATLRYRRLQNLPPKNSAHKNRSLYNQRVSTRTLPDIYPSKEHNLRQIPVLPRTTAKQRITGNILQPTPGTRVPCKTRKSRRRSNKRLIYLKCAQLHHTNGTAVRG